MQTALARPYPNPFEDAVAMIDIGSNSVRMMVYNAPTRVPIPVYTEKYLCGLGRGLAKTGQLNPAGAKEAAQVVARFLAMAKRMRVNRVEILATAAVRDASDGQDFAKQLERDNGTKVQVISGEREAELAAQGVLASFYQPRGITADLGGGSLELAYVNRDHIDFQSTFELGVLRLVDQSGGDIAEMERIISAHFKKAAWLKQVEVAKLYAIGGSFRTLAKLHMRKNKYPLPILHEYTIARASMGKLIGKIKAMTPEEIARLPGVPAKRANTLVAGSLMLQRLLQITKAEEIVFSVSGIREGYLFDKLKPDARMQDPLIASAADLAILAGRRGSYAGELEAWMKPLFKKEQLQFARLRQAFCMLSELAWMIDPNFKSEWAYHRIMQSALKGLNHKERVMLALAMYHRYQAKWKEEQPEFMLLDEYERLWSRTVGIAGALAFHLTGGRSGNFDHAPLAVVNGEVTLSLDADASPLLTDTVTKRLEGLGVAFKAFSNLDK